MIIQDKILQKEKYIVKLPFGYVNYFPVKDIFPEDHFKYFLKPIVSGTFTILFLIKYIS